MAHLFLECLEKNNKAIKYKLFQDLNAHVPHTRTNEDTPTGQSNNLSAQPFAFNSSTSNPLPNNSPIKRSRFCAIFAKVAHIYPSTQKPIPIPINNYLPSVCLHLGSVEDEENKMRMLLDTGAAMDSGSLTYHLWVMSQCPEMVGEFIQCGDGTGYDVFQLLAALHLDSRHQPLDHGKIKVVIRYKTLYFINKRDPLFIYFVLENDVSLRCVLGLPIC